MLETFTVDTFSEGDRLTLHRPDEASLELLLVEVSGLTGDAEGRQPFSLLFRGPVEPQLDQSTYAVEHAEVGAFELFLVPIGSDDQGVRYEAIFC